MSPSSYAGPGHVQPGSQSAQLVSLTDLLATVAAILDTEVPPAAGEDSYNFLPALHNTPGATRQAIVHHSGDGMFAIRQGHWKLILGRGSGGFTAPRRYTPTTGEPPGQLYNLQEDPAEQNNLYATETAVVTQLTALLERYQMQGHSQP